MSTAPSDSLLDAEDFFAELATLEVGMAENRRADSPIAELTAAIRTAPPGKFADEPPARPAPVQARPERVIVFSHGIATIVLTLMAGVGAAAAVLVFHERLARILLRIQ